MLLLTAIDGRAVLRPSCDIAAAVFLLLLKYQWDTNRGSFYGTCIVLSGSLLLEIVYRGITRRGFVLREVTLLKRGGKNLKGELDKEFSQLLPRQQRQNP